VTRRRRLAAFGSAAFVAIAGVVCGVVVSGEAGQLLAIALLSIGLGGIVLLVFLEVGLSEDRERAREAARRERQAARGQQAAERRIAPWRRTRTRPRRPG
jgi:hypothetical protein